MNTPDNNEQTLRPVDGVVEEFDEMMHTGYHKDIKVWLSDTLTTERDAAYTMLRELITQEQRKYRCPPDNGNDYDHGAWVAFDKALKALDTIYGKTHTV